MSSTTFLADQDLATLKEAKRIVLSNLNGVACDVVEHSYRATLASIEHEIEARARLRDAEFRSTMIKVL